MKLASSLFMLPGENNYEKIKAAKVLGLSGLELRTYDGSADFDKDLKDIERGLAETGIAPTDLILSGARFRLDLDSEAVLAEKLQYAKDSIDYAAHFGVGPIICPGLDGQPLVGAYDPLRRLSSQDKALLLRFLTEAANYAAQKNTHIFIEPVNRFENRYFYSPDDAAECIREAGCDNIFIIADTFHMNIEVRDIPACLKRNKDFIRHVHLGDNTREMPGYGSFDFAMFTKALKAIGYDGYMALECRMPNPDTDLQDYVKLFTPLIA